MSRSKTRVDVVVGVTPQLSEQIENFRKDMAAQKGSHVTRTDAIRALFNLAFEKAAARPAGYSSAPRYSPAEAPIPVSQ